MTQAEHLCPILNKRDTSVLDEYKALLHQFKFKPKKRLGQHFLIDAEMLNSIISAAALTSEDIVIEVGPGLGTLTRRLAEQVAKVIAVELDSRLVSILKRSLDSFSNISIIHGDILKIVPSQLLGGLAQNYKVVANLPYYITSPTLRHFLEASLKPSLMVVMVQNEVGEAMSATPGKMSLLSVSTQFYSKPTVVTYVPRENFYPPPKVDSIVLRLDIYSKPPIEISDIVSFFDIVKCGFSSPRKQLRNSLAQALGMPASQVVLLLEKAGIEANRRAETLSLEEWKKVREIFTLFSRKQSLC
jgi:16S rRNA (adenine1518-N6/adenine1519-N6)-dimethyltransferase